MREGTFILLPAIILAGSLNAQIGAGVFASTDAILDNVASSRIEFDGYGTPFQNIHKGNKKPIPYEYLRQGDVSWEKRIWRTIDLREKLNQPMMFPIVPAQNRISLFSLIQQEIKKDKLVVYADDDFKTALTKEQTLKQFSIERVVKKYTIDGEENGDTTFNEEISSDKILQYKVKEDWFFEKEKSVMEVRIMGICPVYYDEAKEIYIEKGWIYFPQARNMLASETAFNPKNDAEQITYDELFQKRYFNSFIYKESNVFDRNINEYSKGMDALIESDKIKNDMFLMEHDLWHF
jgi:gliding motility associated protien GldN